MLGMPPFTFIHTLISLVGIATGLVVLFGGLLANKLLPRWTAWFLASTILTSVTGFMLPAERFMPSHAVGILSLLILAVALIALYAKHLSGAWRRTYVITAVIALYLNVFVLVAQLFLKVPVLKALAPKGNEPPFMVAQGVVLVAFIVVGALAASRFRPATPPSAA
jgi:Na+/H+ antiporter NhaC